MSESRNRQQGTTASETAPAAAAQRLQVRLEPHADSGQPIFSNFVIAQGAGGTVFIDFGFFEPNALPAAVRQAQASGKTPEVVTGRLACRVALGLDSAAQLAQQLNQVLQSAVAQAQAQRAAAAKAAPEK